MHLTREPDLEHEERLASLHLPKRLEVLARSGLLDTEPEPAFDRLTECAALLLDAPVALVSLVDQDRQFFKSCIGLPEPWSDTRQTPLSHSFCQLVTSGEPLVIDDARNHPLVQDNPAIEDLGVQAYLGYPLVTRTGHVVGSLCVIDDKPREWTPEDRKHVEDLAAFASTEIELRLALILSEERTRQEQKTTRRLQQVEHSLLETLRRREEILGIVTHDLRDPLNTIRLCTSLISEAAQGEPLSLTRKIDRAVGRMHVLLEDLLDLTREDSEDLVHEPEPRDAAEIVSEAVDAFEVQAEEQGVALTWEAPGEPVRVEADPFRIQQVLANLISNALRHTPESGEIRLGVEAREDDDGQVRFRVEDTGSGIEPEVLPYVFEPFRQGSRGTLGQSGLGLAIVKKIVETHGGRVGIKSREGQGTTCWFTLPRA